MPYSDPEKDREYHRRYDREAYHFKMSLARAFLGDRCVVCGVTTTLEFDHVDPNGKRFSITRQWKSRDWEIELVKCQLLCRKCHRRKSNAELSAEQRLRDEKGRYTK